MDTKMEYSKQGLDLTKGFESCKLTAYQDVKGVWTIGWGTTGPDIVEGLQWTQNEADSALVTRYVLAESTVNRLVTVPLTQGEFDALCDFVYNCGGGAFASSTMLKLLNNGDYTGAAEQFDRWDKAGGKVIAGLLRRRQAETDEFNQT
jgi:lysozyme